MATKTPAKTKAPAKPKAEHKITTALKQVAAGEVGRTTKVQVKKSTPPAARPAPKPKRPEGEASKGDKVLELLKTKGATSKELADLTGWTLHSVHGLLNKLKKAHNLTTTKLKGEPIIYRIVVAKKAGGAAEIPADVI